MRAKALPPVTCGRCPRRLSRWDWLLWAILAIVGPAVGYHAGFAAADRQARVVAVCPNFDSLVATGTPWQREHGRLPRVLVPVEACRVPNVGAR